MGALPLRGLSRLWGYLNGLELPMWFRPMGFKFYAFLFGCNLSEIDPEDLTQYASLGEFFYRKLKPDARPIASSLLVRPFQYVYPNHQKVTVSQLGLTCRRSHSPFRISHWYRARGTSQRHHLLSGRSPGSTHWFDPRRTRPV